MAAPIYQHNFANTFQEIVAEYADHVHDDVVVFFEYYRTEHDALGMERFSEISSPTPSLVTRIAMTEHRIQDYCCLRAVEIYRSRLARGKSTWFPEVFYELACDPNLYGRKNDAGYWLRDAEDFLDSVARFREKFWWLPVSRWLVEPFESQRSDTLFPVPSKAFGFGLGISRTGLFLITFFMGLTWYTFQVQGRRD